VRTNRDRKGFTLLEVMLASVMGAFIALVAIGTLQTVTAAKERIEANTTCADELRFAADMVHDDLVNLYRDTDAAKVKLVGILEDAGDGITMNLTMHVVGTAKARSTQPEGDLYEVQYFLHIEEEKSALMRRWCPIVGIEDDTQTQGGILTVIAENIVGFDMRFFDGSEWQIEWPSELNSLPHLVEVILTAHTGGDEEKPLVMARNFIVSFPRLAEQVQSGSAVTAEEESE
jgi:type II secretion system protein J